MWRYDERERKVRRFFFCVEAIRTSAKGSNPSPPQIFCVSSNARQDADVDCSVIFLLRANLQNNTKMNQTDDYIIKSAPWSSHAVCAPPSSPLTACPQTTMEKVRAKFDTKAFLVVCFSMCQKKNRNIGKSIKFSHLYYWKISQDRCAHTTTTAV